MTNGCNGHYAGRLWSGMAQPTRLLACLFMVNGRKTEDGQQMKPEKRTAQPRYSLIAAADRWAKANASDPFAKRTAMAYLERHKFNPPFTPDGLPTYYDATEGTETRMLPDGTKYQAVVYTNLVRP